MPPEGEIPWTMAVRCVSSRCPNEGNEQVVSVQRVAPGFVAWTSIRCAGCGCEALQVHDAGRELTR